LKEGLIMSFDKGPYQPEPGKKKSHSANGSNDTQSFRTGDGQYIEASGKEKDSNKESPPCEKKGSLFEKIIKDSNHK
jgi:hypothetical protein